MLTQLTQSREATYRALQAMPFVIETPSQVRTKSGLEKKLLEIENALSVFSRRRVFVEA